MIEQEEDLKRLHNSKLIALENRYAAHNAAEKAKFKKAKAQLKGKGACAKKYAELQGLWYKQLAYFRDLNIQNEDNAKNLRKAKQALIDTKVSYIKHNKRKILFKEICQFRAQEIAAAQNTERLKLKKEIAQLEIRLKHVQTHETYAVHTKPSAHGDQ